MQQLRDRDPADAEQIGELGLSHLERRQHILAQDRARWVGRRLGFRFVLAFISDSPPSQLR